MKKLIALMLSLISVAALAACGAVSAEDAALTEKYLPENAVFVRTEKDDGFTEQIYRDDKGGEYVLIEDRGGALRAIEYESAQRPLTTGTALTQEEAFAVITAVYPEAVLVAAFEDMDDGRAEWNILFTDEGLLGFYELDAITGEVLDYDLFFAKGEVIDPAAIITANLPGAQLKELSLDIDDGRLYIEGEAIQDLREIEFTIDADTGVVVEVEYDD